MKKFFGVGKKSRRRKTVDRIRDFRERREAKDESANRPGRREILIASFAGLNLVITPWLVAGQPLWAQWVSLALALPAFAWLFLPVGYDGWRSATPRAAWDELRRCWPFWGGLLLAAGFACQALNPAYAVEFDGGTWLVMPKLHVSWLPHGVAAPMDRQDAPGGMNAWRTLLIFASPWFTFCALWCGVESRRITRRLGVAFLLSASLLAIFAVGMRAAGETHLYGQIPVSIGSVFGPFLYQNQAAAFLCLASLFATTFALTEWRAVPVGSPEGGIHLAVSAGALLIAFAAIASGSFAADIQLLCALPVVLLAVLRTLAGRGGAEGASSQAGVVLAVALVVLAAVVMYAGDFGGAVDKLRSKIFHAQAGSLDDREPLRAATLRMYRDADPLWGYGAGSYRWVSPRYFSLLPEFCDAEGVLNRRANYAHCDWLQILAEWGLFGLTTVAACLLWMLYKLRKVFTPALAHTWPLGLGLALLAAHASMDFLLFNPAVLLAAAWAVCYLRLRCRRASRAVA